MEVTSGQYAASFAALNQIQRERYPEVEKLLLLSRAFNISLDSLMSTEIVKGTCPENNKMTGTIVISSPYENAVVTCYKVMSSQKMLGGRKSPQYALFGVSGGVASFWGEPTTFLGWYANYEMLSKEVSEIQQAIMLGVPSYELKYSVKAETKWFRRVMVDEL